MQIPKRQKVNNIIEKTILFSIEGIIHDALSVTIRPLLFLVNFNVRKLP